MRLLKTDTLELVEFVDRVPPYTILSHTWGNDEVTFQDLMTGSNRTAAVKKKAGYAKIAGFCARSVEDGYDYAWVDTCCIDKTSSAELSEAINSMYRWYQEAHICYAYMSDVSLDAALPPAPPPGPDTKRAGDPTRPSFRTIPSILREYDSLPRTFENSRWFTRGWTLQELIAPPLVEFYTYDWKEIGTKFSLRKAISKITGIDMRVLEGADPSTCHVAERMSWAANRQTTRIEDAAYCLLGIFKVHMPLIYGEGSRAFFRLQKEIMKTTEDYTMLAWGLSKYLSNKHHWKIQGSGPTDRRQPLAESPNDFELHNRATWTYSSLVQHLYDPKAPKENGLDDTPPLMTSRGLRVSLLIRHMPKSGDVYAYINCKTTRPGAAPDAPPSPVCLILRHQEGSASNVYLGSDNPNASFAILDGDKDLAAFQRRTIYFSSPTADNEPSLRHNHRINSLEKNLYMLEKPRPPRVGEPAAAAFQSWKITSCFSHAVGAGAGHSHFEVLRKFSPAALYQPFDLPPSTIRVFAFEQQQLGQGQAVSTPASGEAFAIVVGNGWCDVVAIRDVEFRAKWGLLVRDGYWNEVLALKYMCHVAQNPCGDGDESADRVLKKVGGVTVSVALKKVRKGDINCESAVKIVWSTI
ncbi:heterokaryon incompatibility protein-domain-containing protein [Echria macrotheca]|uniref:Heterokaryon incompatibility protein-domain-containing protein n=1 Tax=Echria macrotheca TaxID=438768 RepID=A0AAJ0F0P6_9PEZI|nr:heterokaryon incompatibility protein-domain-containing protein [Echria macrotheca]